jgi:hypothetical protein
MRLVGHVACIGDMGNKAMFLLENVKGTDHLEDLGADEELLQWILGKQGERCGLDVSGSG